MQISLRLSRVILLIVALLWTLTVTLSVTPAKAQIVRIDPGLGVHVNAPGVNIHIAPRYGVGQAYGLPRQRVRGRRRRFGQPYDPRTTGRPDVTLEPRPDNSNSRRRGMNLRPSLDQPSTPSAMAQTDVPDPARTFPTANDLANLDDAMLLETLLDISNRLDTRLARFKTGAGWQRYLRLPEEVLAPDNDQESLQARQEVLRETLSRFEQVANNSDFRVIASQPSFVAAQTVLREVVTRMDQENAVTPTTSTEQEVLPVPEPVRRHPAPTGERSILKR